MCEAGSQQTILCPKFLPANRKGVMNTLLRVKNLIWHTKLNTSYLALFKSIIQVGTIPKVVKDVNLI